MLCTAPSEITSEHFIDRFEIGSEHIDCLVAGEWNYNYFRRSGYHVIDHIQDNVITRGYDREVKFLLELKDGRLAVGNITGIVKIWNLPASKCEKVTTTGRTYMHTVTNGFLRFLGYWDW
jgi:hypothetical protein